MRVLALVVAALAAGGQVSAQAPVLQWALTLDGPGDVVRTEWSPTSSCVAAATPTTVFVVGVPSGRLLWQWNYRKSSRSLRVSESSPMALSPDCKVVVVAGDPGYKYIWNANSQGRTQQFKTQGTPLAARFDVSGQNVAVVTGARRGYLLSPGLDVRWSGALEALPVRWAGQVSGVANAGAPVYHQRDVERLLGALLWGWGVNDSVSDDGQWRVVSTLEPRGPGMGTVEFYGPDAQGYRGRYVRMQPRWSKEMGCPSAELASDGMFALVTGNPAEPSSWCETDNGLKRFVFDRDGRTIVEAPHSRSAESEPASWREDVMRAVLARTGKPLKVSAAPPQPGREKDR